MNHEGLEAQSLRDLKAGGTSPPHTETDPHVKNILRTVPSTLKPLQKKKNSSCLKNGYGFNHTPFTL